MYQINELIVHPMHGAGRISDIVERKVAGKTSQYYVMHIQTGDVDVLIPVDSVDKIGVREVIDRETALKVIESVSSVQEGTAGNWNQRYRDNSERIKSGDLFEVASVVSGLIRRDNVKPLSTGERRMLHAAKLILISELKYALELNETEIDKQITDAALGH